MEPFQKVNTPKYILNTIEGRLARITVICSVQEKFVLCKVLLSKSILNSEDRRLRTECETDKGIRRRKTSSDQNIRSGGSTPPTCDWLSRTTRSPALSGLWDDEGQIQRSLILNKAQCRRDPRQIRSHTVSVCAEALIKPTCNRLCVCACVCTQ